MMPEQADEGYVLFREMEHQELWYPQSNLRKPVDVHIPSALGALGYYVCVLVPAQWADKLDKVEVKAKIGGLRPDDLHLKSGEGIDIEDRFPAVEPGRVWRLLCRAYMSRGDGIIEVANWPRELGKTDLLLCTWPRYIASGQADAWLNCRRDPLWAPTGIPLGGIGGGRVDLCRDGRLRNFTGNNNQDMPLEEPDGLPGAGFVVMRGGEMRSLTTMQAADSIRPFGKLAFEGRFPRAELSARGLFPGVDVSVRAMGPICPHNLRWSSIPGMLMRWHLKNNSNKVQHLTCMFVWPNLIGIGGGIAQEETDIGKGDGVYCYWEDTEGQSEVEIGSDVFAGVLFTGGDSPHRLNSAGRHLLAVKRDGLAAIGTRAGEGFGSVWREVILEPGDEATFDMSLVWAMPHWVDTKGTDRGHYWQNDFAGAEDMTAELLNHAGEIFQQAGALAELFERTSLPDWLKARMANCNYPLVANSVLLRDGRFSINEGPTEMAGCYGTIDQRLGSHPSTQIFFPELNARELAQFAAIQAPNGGISHDLGHGHLERPANEQPWPDIPCSFVIQCARHAWTTGDGAFDDVMWPRARRALLRCAAWAEAGGGVPQVGRRTGLGTSYDGYHYEGTTPYLGTLWLAALAVAEEWARKRNDCELLPQIEKWRTAAVERMEADLWNGSFYRTYGSVDGPARDTSHAGQLAGQVFARMLAGKNVLPDDRLKACVDALMRLNGSSRFALPPDEAQPSGEAPVEFSWLPYVEAFALTAAATLRDHRVLPLWERMMMFVDQDGERPCDTRLMYRPSNGEPSWGSWYMTAPASWLVYDSLLDFSYTPGDGVLRLVPQFTGTLAVVHPLWWGSAEVKADGITLIIDRVFAEGPMAVRSVELLDGDGSGYRRQELTQPVMIKPGARIHWEQPKE
ncbi:MAG TPA: GH116 family glycosyl-hydrolase [Planctomycetota bacterium]|nr:GH116 family glycosyl-hydrolase [Planctomycetota bacterium]